MNNINLHRMGSVLQKPIANNSIQNKTKNNTVSFEDTLKDVESKGLKFSKHAQTRMDKRNLKLDTNEIKKLEDAIGKAEKKGIKETLIIMNNQAFIANVANRTIITAISSEGSKDNIFTNIDGAVII